jgi:hypothetical protein
MYHCKKQKGSLNLRRDGKGPVPLSGSGRLATRRLKTGHTKTPPDGNHPAGSLSWKRLRGPVVGLRVKLDQIELSASCPAYLRQRPKCGVPAYLLCANRRHGIASGKMKEAPTEAAIKTERQIQSYRRLWPAWILGCGRGDANCSDEPDRHFGAPGLRCRRPERSAL